jgi:RNA polymerase sigma-70 factor (sigma-E family)
MADAHGFDEFYRTTRGRLVAFLWGMTGDRAEAQDAAQEAYARAWQRWGVVSGYADPEAWVRVVAWRVAASRWRKARNRTLAQRRHGPATTVPAPGEDTVVLTSALRRLPMQQRVALVLHHIGDLPVEEVARQTSAPVGTVKARLSRGRTALSALLRDREESHPA